MPPKPQHTSDAPKPPPSGSTSLLSLWTGGFYPRSAVLVGPVDRDAPSGFGTRQRRPARTPHTHTHTCTGRRPRFPGDGWGTHPDHKHPFLLLFCCQNATSRNASWRVPPPILHPPKPHGLLNPSPDSNLALLVAPFPPSPRGTLLPVPHCCRASARFLGIPFISEPLIGLSLKMCPIWPQ